MNIREDVKEVAELSKAAAENYYEQVKLKAIRNIVMSISKGMLFAVLGLLFIVFLILINIGASFYVGKLMNSQALGFVIVAGVNLLIIVVVGFLRKRFFSKMIANLVVMEIVEDWIPEYE